MSPNYPDVSPPGLNCTWTIQGPEDAHLLLYFDDSSLKRNDYLLVMYYIYFVHNLHFYILKACLVVQSLWIHDRENVWNDHTQSVKYTEVNCKQNAEKTNLCKNVSMQSTNLFICYCLFFLSELSALEILLTPRVESLFPPCILEVVFLHMGQGFPHQLPVLENVILHPPCKTSRVR